MISRALPSIWRKMAENMVRKISVFSFVGRCANLIFVNDGTSIGRLSRIPSLFRGLASFGAAPVLLPARLVTQQMTNPFPKNLPLSARMAGTRPKRTDHV